MPRSAPAVKVAAVNGYGGNVIECLFHALDGKRRQSMKPTPEMVKDAYTSTRYSLPRHLLDALAKFRANRELREVLGADFVTVLLEIKQAEWQAYQQVISAWEREHLLLNV